VDADLDTLATALYVKTDDLLKTCPQRAPWRPPAGISPEISDAELVTLAVLQANSGLAVQVDFLDRAAAECAANGGLVPPGPPLQVIGCRGAEPGEPALSQNSLRLLGPELRQPGRPPVPDRFPAVVTAGPGAGRGAANDAAFRAHEGEEGGRDVLRTIGPWIEANRVLMQRAVDRGEFPPADIMAYDV
jgi:hypothetical protein